MQSLVRVQRRTAAAGAADAGLGEPGGGLEKSRVDGAEQGAAAADGQHILPQPRVADAEIGALVLLALIVHQADHGEAYPVVLRVGLHVHAERAGVGQEGLERLVQLLVDWNEAAEVLDTDLQAAPVAEKAQVVAQRFVGIAHRFPSPHT